MNKTYSLINILLQLDCYLMIQKLYDADSRNFDPLETHNPIETTLR